MESGDCNLFNDLTAPMGYVFYGKLSCACLGPEGKFYSKILKIGGKISGEENSDILC